MGCRCCTPGTGTSGKGSERRVGVILVGVFLVVLSVGAEFFVVAPSGSSSLLQLTTHRSLLAGSPVVDARSLLQIHTGRYGYGGAVDPSSTPSVVLWEDEEEPLELLEHTERTKFRSSAASSRWQPSGWFGDYAEGESTYDRGTEDELDRDLRLQGPSSIGSITRSSVDSTPGTGEQEAQWFDESRSDGPQQALQTHFPVLGDLAPRGAAHPHWTQLPDGQWHQDHGPPLQDRARVAGKHPGWFDMGTTEYDAFGRVRASGGALGGAPGGAGYAQWAARSRNVSLVCAARGCTANATVSVADISREAVRGCRLSVGLFPTDFDDDHSREYVEWIQVNGRTVNTLCNPQASGCNASTQPALHPCIRDMRLPELMWTEGGGEMNISAKLSPAVDECPYEGNLLSGVVTVTCQVAPIQKRNATAQPVIIPEPPTRPLASTVKLQCFEPGCIASTSLRIAGANASGRTCRMFMRLNQTDFDDAEEQIDWIVVDGETVASSLKPGYNPCKAPQRLANATLNATPAQELTFMAVDGRNVTSAIADGQLMVSAKISDMVDECGREGGLLDAEVTVVCEGRKGANVTS